MGLKRLSIGEDQKNTNYGGMDGLTDGQTDRWTNRLMDGWADRGPMDGYVYPLIEFMRTKSSTQAFLKMIM